MGAVSSSDRSNGGWFFQEKENLINASFRRSMMKSKEPQSKAKQSKAPPTSPRDTIQSRVRLVPYLPMEKDNQYLYGAGYREMFVLYKYTTVHLLCM